MDQEPKQIGRTRIGTAGQPIAVRPTLGNAILSGDALNFGMIFGTGGGNRTHTGFRPTDFLTRYGFHRHPGLGRLGSGLSLHHHRIRPVLGAARLVSTPSPFGAWLGIAI